MKLSKSETQAMAVIQKAKALGFNLEVQPNVVRVHKTFKPGDSDTFAYCDTMASEILDLCPLRGGSIWGTDGGSVGGAVALQSGRFSMNKSGSALNFTKALSKLLENLKHAQDIAADFELSTQKDLG